MIAGVPPVHERFRPLAHTPPEGFVAGLRFQARLLADFHVRTVHAHVRRFLADARGELLDVGCGRMPYRHLVPTSVRYIGVDTTEAESFGYGGQESVLRLEGDRIPLPDASVDHVLCTEVLEHIPEPRTLVAEVHRVLKPGGTALFTVPWSARYHYIPHDYFRFTPSALARLFENFASVVVEPRGTDVTTIASKLVAVSMRQVLGARRNPLSIIAFAACAPFTVLAIAVGHLSLAARVGSSDDPLGYTVWLRR